MKTMEAPRPSHQREEITTLKAVMIVAQTVEKPIQVQVHSLIHRTRAPGKDIKSGLDIF
jgi:hypothetical protein